MCYECACDCDYGEAEWYYRFEIVDAMFIEHYATDKHRRQRCVSCKTLFYPEIGCGLFDRFRDTRSEVEERIYGDCGEVPLANWYVCHECSDAYQKLDAIGFCIYLGNMDFRKELALLERHRGVSDGWVLKGLDALQVWNQGIY